MAWPRTDSRELMSRLQLPLRGLLHLPETKVHGLAEDRLQGTDVRLQGTDVRLHIPLQGLLHLPKTKVHGLAEDRLQGTDVRLQIPLQYLQEFFYLLAQPRGEQQP
jgi:hypothetical protein